MEFVGRTKLKNGVKGYILPQEYPSNPKGTISVSQIGTISSQLREREWYSSQNIFILSPLSTIKIEVSKFLVGVINKSLEVNFSSGYSNYPTLKTLRSLKILLPIKGGVIDSKFIESFIADLEAERIATLDSYLTAAGLKDYNLTAEEDQALHYFESNKFCWGEFTYRSIFNKIEQGRRLKKDDQTPGEVPFVMSGITNTGVVNHVSNPISMFPKNSITVDIFGNAFFRNYDYGAGDDTGAYWNDENHYPIENMLFFASAMEKSIFGKYSYGNKLRSSNSFDLKMVLPIKNNNDDLAFYDLALMKVLISAVKKLVIRDVVLYAEQKVLAHKEVLVVS